MAGELIAAQIGANQILSTKIAAGEVQPADLGLPVRNQTGGVLAAGSFVVVNSWNAAQDRALIVAADADAGGHFDVWFLAAAMNNNTNATALKKGTLTGVDTSLGAEGDPVYLSTTAGGWTLTAPAGAGARQIVVGRVELAHAAGVIEVDLAAQRIPVKLGNADLQPGIASADATGRALLADGVLDAATVALKVAVDAFTTASFSGAAKKFAAGALDVAGTLSVFAANAMSEANVDAIVAAGAINGAKTKAATIAGSKQTADARVRFVTVHIPGTVFGATGLRRMNILPGIAGTVQAMQLAFEPGPNALGNVILDLNKNQGLSMFTVPPDFSMNLNPSTVRKTVDNGASYTNYTVEATDGLANTEVDISGLDVFANGDWLVIGHATLKFGRIYVDVSADAGEVNATASNLSGEYWNGAAWVALTGFLDGTAAAGACFAQDGIINFDIPNAWAKNTIDGVEAYHVRLIVSALIDVGANAVMLDEIRVGHGDRRYQRYVCDQNNTIVATDTVDLAVDDADATVANADVILEILPT